MKTIKIKVYQYDELSDEAKENARNEFTQNMEYYWGNEAIESLEAFLKRFNCELRDYSIDFLEPYRNQYSIKYPDFYRPSEKIAFIQSTLDELGSYNPETLKGTGECKLTGVCFDEPLIDGVRIEFNKGETDIEELIKAGIHLWEQEVKSDYESQFTDEYLSEHFEANEYEFLEDGTRY